jgi:hypothetical protein
MKTNTTAGALALLVLLGGCVVTSVHPFYTEKDLVYDPQLLGTWEDPAKPEKSTDHVVIQRLGEKGYIATIFNEKEVGSIELHLFELNQQLFLDVCPTNRSLDYVPARQLVKVISKEPELKTTNLDYDWLKKLLEKNPETLQHVVVPNEPGGSEGRIVLTAKTADLQKFLLKYMNDKEAWKSSSTFKRK